MSVKKNSSVQVPIQFKGELEGKLTIHCFYSLNRSTSASLLVGCNRNGEVDLVLGDLISDCFQALGGCD